MEYKLQVMCKPRLVISLTFKLATFGNIVVVLFTFVNQKKNQRFITGSSRSFYATRDIKDSGNDITFNVRFAQIANSTSVKIDTISRKVNVRIPSKGNG